VGAKLVTSMGHKEGEEFSKRDIKFLNYVQLFWTMSNTLFQGVENFSGGTSPPSTRSYGPGFQVQA